MTNRLLLGISLLLALAPSATRARAADLAGTWELVSVENTRADGTKVAPYGEHPDGRLTFDAAGRYSLLIFRAGRPRFAASDKSRGTAEENRDTVQGTNSHFGRYAVDGAAKTLTFHIDHASFPNWEGTEQQRSFTLEGGVLRYVVRTTTSGGSEVAEVTWRRLP